MSCGDATGRIVLMSAMLSIITILAILFIREVTLRTGSGDQRIRALAPVKGRARRRTSTSSSP